jgi:signal transduction histidine kinase/ligand-binding sensor domain-containing protein
MNNLNTPLFRAVTLFLLLSVLHPPTAISFPDKVLSSYLARQWNDENGLPTRGIDVLLQSHDGYLWIGSRQGLYRFDGVRFVPFDRTRFPALRSSHIKALFEDSQHNLWIGTSGGGVSILKGDSLRTLTSRQGLGSDFVRAIVEDSSGIIWVGTDGEGITAVRADTLVTYGRGNSILDGRVTSLCVDRKHTLWIGTYAGLFSFNGNLFTRLGREEGLPCDTVISLFNRDDGLWIGTYGGGLARFRDGKFDTYGREEGLPGTIVTSIASDRNGTLWFTVLRGGICHMKCGRIEHRVFGDPKQGEFSVAVTCDRERNIWLGLLNGGLVRLRKPLFSWFPFDATRASVMVNSVTEDCNGTIWAGTSDGVKTLRGNKFVDPPPGGIPRVLTMAVLGDKNGFVWAGSWNTGLFRLKGGNSEKVQLPGASTVWALCADSDGTVWAGTTSGLYRISGRTIKRFTHDQSGLSHDDVRAIARGSDGSLWVGTSYGLNKMEKDTVLVFTTKNSRLPNDVIIALHIDRDGTLWVGTEEGIARVSDDSVTAFTMQEGLPEGAAGQIIGDGRGYLWIVSDRGLYRVSKSDLDQVATGKLRRVHVNMFDREDGVLHTNLSGTVQPAAMRSHDGLLWFSAQEGVAMVNAGTMREKMARPHVVIESVTVDGTPLPLGSSLEVEHDFGQFEISYTAPSFVNPDRIVFRYMLEGLDKGWVEAGRRRTAYYTKASPGSYVFRVVAGDEDQTWTDTEASFRFTVLPPIWMTWWFLTIAVMGFLSVGPLIYFRRVRQLKRAHAMQQEVSGRLIMSQEAERKRIAAELHDGLGQSLVVIKNRAVLGRQTGEDAQLVREQLDEIANTAAAMLDDVRRIAHNLRPVHLERFGMTDSIRSMIEAASSGPSISFTAEIDNVDGVLTKEDEIHVFRVVQEAISNILKHSSATTAVIEIRRTMTGMNVIVRDNGRGFAPEHVKGGLGLSDIEERVKLLGGILSINSALGRGTTVNAMIPAREGGQRGA